MFESVTSWFRSPKPPVPYRPTSKVVIVGNGLAGVAAGRELNRQLASKGNLAEVTIVGPNDQFVFKPRLHETLNGKTPFIPMREMFPLGKPVQYRKAEVTKININPDKKTLDTSEGPLSYDYLIVAVGGKTAYYGHDKAIQFAIPIECPADMDRMKLSIDKKLALASKAALNSPEQQEDLSFVVVGGGATGVETVFELQESVEAMIKSKYPQLKAAKPTFTIVEGSPDILNGFTENERNYLKKRLKERGVYLLVNHQVQDIGPKGLSLLDKSDPKAPKTKSVNTIEPVWATGVRANPLVESMAVERLPGNQRVKVNPFLEIPNRPDLYVIGDSSAFVDSTTNRPLPPTGQVAQQEGYFVAKDLVSKLEGQKPDDAKRSPFKFDNQGTMFSIGQSDGCVTTKSGWFFAGLKANLLRRGVYYKKANHP